jgi:transposase
VIHLTCTEDEIEALRYEHFHHPHPRVQMKMAAVQLTALGLSRSVVARVVGCSETTVRSYLKAYQGGGIEALKDFSVGGSTSDLEAHRDSLREEFDQRPPRSVHEAQHRIHQLTGLQRSPSQVRAYLQRLGLKYRKVAPIPAKANPEVQEQFLTDQLEPVLKEAKAGQRHVLFVDALWGALHKASNVERMVMLNKALEVSVFGIASKYHAT